MLSKRSVFVSAIRDQKLRGKNAFKTIVGDLFINKHAPTFKTGAGRTAGIFNN